MAAAVSKGSAKRAFAIVGAGILSEFYENNIGFDFDEERSGEH